LLVLVVFLLLAPLLLFSSSSFTDEKIAPRPPSDDDDDDEEEEEEEEESINSGSVRLTTPGLACTRESTASESTDSSSAVSSCAGVPPIGVGTGAKAPLIFRPRRRLWRACMFARTEQMARHEESLASCEEAVVGAAAEEAGAETEEAMRVLLGVLEAPTLGAGDATSSQRNRRVRIRLMLEAGTWRGKDKMTALSRVVKTFKAKKSGWISA